MVNVNMLLLFICFYLVSRSLVFGGSKQNRKQTVTAFKDCDIPSTKYDVDNYVNHTFTTVKNQGQTYLRANFTINKETPNVTFHLRGYALRNGLRQKDFDGGKLTCRHPVTTTILKNLKLVYEPFNCTGRPGEYYVPRLSMDVFSRFYQYMIRGHSSYIIEVELSSNRGVMICMAITLKF